MEHQPGKATDADDDGRDELPLEQRCEQLTQRTKILGITIEFEYVDPAGQTKSDSVTIEGDTRVLVTDMSLAWKVRRGIMPGLKPHCEKPPHVKPAIGNEELQPPECCYYIKDKWICW